MTVRFQADVNLNQIILLAAKRREPSLDFQTAVAASLAGLSDREVLAVSALEGRVLVTHDRKTMPKHFFDFLASETSARLLIIPQSLPVAPAAEDLLLIWHTTEAEEWINQLRFLPL